MTKKRSIFSCDFETTTNPLDCRVWAFGYMELYNHKNTMIGNSMDEFMNWLIRSNSNIYFHNLKFDGSFIVNYLLSNGWKWFKTSQIVKLREGEFTTIISNQGQWYSIELKYKVGKKKSHVKIYDSHKKLPFSVSTIAKAFELPLLKGNIDYHKYRPIGYEITEDEKSYINNDIEIIARALEIQFSQNLTKMTNGSDALNEFEQLSGRLFEKLYPILSLDLNAELRRAYKGGFTWVNPKYQGLDVKEGRVYDVNSLYPWVMYECDLPCGHPVYYEGEYKQTKGYPLYIQKVTFSFHIKDNHIPCIQIKGNSRYGFKETEYLSHSNGERVTLYLSSVDWQLIKDHYIIEEVEFHYGYMFRKTNNAFKNYIDKWIVIKNTNKGAIKQIAKLMLNSLYGKFATNPNVTGKIPYLKDNGALGFKLGDEDFRDPVYTPVGVFTTAYAREKTIRTAQENYDRIIYCDTDSIHLEGLEIPNIDISEDKLGAWKHEGAFKRAKFIRQKTYVEDYFMKYVRDSNNEIIYNDGKAVTTHCEPNESDTTKLDVKCAGMPDDVKKHVTFDNFNIGFKHGGKLTPKQVKNGVVLVDVGYSMN